MSTTRTITDTADRLRTCDHLSIGGTWRLVTNIAADGRRLAVTVCDPHGSLADLNVGETVHLEPGETVTFRGHMFLADAVGRRPGGTA